jgi:hypothetical protein
LRGDRQLARAVLGSHAISLLAGIELAQRRDQHRTAEFSFEGTYHALHIAISRLLPFGDRCGVCAPMCQMLTGIECSLLRAEI